MDETMAALVYEAPEVMVLREVAVPVAGPDEVVVRVAYSGICGSELSGFLGTSSLRTPPLVFGHELSGVIHEVGPQVPPSRGLAPGTRVAANPLATCGLCRDCRRGRPQLCPDRRLLGAHVPGSNAGYVAVDWRYVLPLPDGVGLADAATAEPAACAVHAVQVSGVGPDDAAFVVGAGPIGLLVLQVLREHGVRRLLVAETNPTRLAAAVDLGAVPVSPSGASRADVAFDCVGAPATRELCVRGVLPGGTVVLVGLHEDATSLPLNTVVREEIHLVGVFAYTTEQFATALRWVGEGRIGLRAGRVVAPLADGPGWFRRLVDGDPAMKVLLRPHDGRAAS